MSNIIDLNELINRTVDIKINEKVIKVKDITISQFERMIEIEKNNDFKEQVKLIVEILNNNKSGVKLSYEEISKLTRPTLICLWTLFITRSVDYATDPN